MVTTTDTYTSSRHRTTPGEGYDGVVRISYNALYGSGVLLYDGRAILTAAHLLNTASANQLSIRMETTAGVASLNASAITLHPQYDAANANHDLAIIWLSSAAPVAANRYTLYREEDEIGRTFVMAGYGKQGSGATGTADAGDALLRLKTENQFDADAAALKSFQGSAMSWTPLTGTLLVADFDDGSASHDALGALMNLSGTGLGEGEGLIAPGDSGGPAFISGKLAGIAGYTAALGYGDTQPDIDSLSNSSFGEVGFWHRISAHQQWIDQSLRAAYPNTPTSAATVEKTITEPNSGASLVYFLLEFTGTRANPDAWISVDYATRDGTALAGSDYLAASGTLILYPDETRAVIPVEVMGDNLAESSEVFYLDVFNPVGGSFGEGVLQLTAMRTILDTD